MFVSKNKNKILNKKTLLAVVLLGIFVLTNFASAAEEVIIRAGELMKLNQTEQINDYYEKKHTNCDEVFAGKLSKLDSDNSWDYGWIPFMGRKDNELTSRWNYSNPILANRTCLIYEKIDLTADFASFLKNFVASGASVAGMAVKTYQDRMINTGITMIEWSNAMTPIGLARTDYAIQVEQKLLYTTFDITQTSFNESVGKKDGDASVVSRIVGWIVNSLINIITSIISILVAWIGNLLAITIERNILISWYPGIVQTGWMILRDIMNMIFILAMIVMAFATILRVEKYNYKHLLVKLVTMALLINFSYFIATSLIDFSNTFAKFFYVGSEWHSLLFILKNVAWGGGVDGGISSIANSISGLILSGVMLFAFLSLTGMFIIRTVGLWMLIILSPAAYALNILPATEEYAKKWWSTFTKYLVWAPVALVFLRLSESLLTQLNQINQDQTSVFNKVMVAAFIIGARKVAEQAGMAGAEMVDKAVDKVKHFGTALVGAGAGALARTYSNKMWSKAREAEMKQQNTKSALYKAAAFLNIPYAKKAWEARSHHLEEEVESKAVGSMHDTLNRIMPTEWHRRTVKVVDPETGDLVDKKEFLGRKTNFGLIEYNRVINKKTKEFNETPLTEEQRVRLFLDATHLDDKIAIYRSIVMNNHQDGLAGAWGVKYNPTDFKQRVFNDLIHAGASEEEAGAQANNISEIAEANRKYRATGEGVVDWDGVARASVDITGVKNLLKYKGEKALFEHLTKMNVLEKVEADGVVVDQSGNEVAVKANEHIFTDADGRLVRKIQNAEEFVKIIEEMEELERAMYKDNDPTAKQKFDQMATEGSNLLFEIKSARAAGESNKRAKRTDSEDLVKALDPATLAVQNTQEGGDGGFSELSSEGRRFAEKLQPSVGLAIPGMRRTQGRAQSLVGGSPQEDGTIDYAGIIGDDEKGIKADPVKLNILVQTAKQGPEIAAGFLSKAKIEQSIALKIRDAVNLELQRRFVGSKKAHKFLQVDAKGDWGVVHEVPSIGSSAASAQDKKSGAGSSTPSNTSEFPRGTVLGPDGRPVAGPGITS